MKEWHEKKGERDKLSTLGTYLSRGQNYLPSPSRCMLVPPSFDTINNDRVPVTLIFFFFFYFERNSFEHVDPNFDRIITDPKVNQLLLYMMIHVYRG